MNQNAPIIGLNVKQFATQWCVYELWKDKEFMYIGACDLSRVFSMFDAKSIAEFNRCILPTDVLSIVIKHTGDRNECYNVRGKMLRSLPILPPINAHMHTKAKMVIRCNEDETEYRTQIEVCKTYNISQSNLSNHLNGKAGYSRIKGLTFTRAPSRKEP